MIGGATYESPNMATEGGISGPNYAFWMSPVRHLNPDPIGFVLSHGGAQTARFLQRSFQKSSGMSLRPGFLGGHPVDVLTIRRWPGTQIGPLVLYLGKGSHLLRGMDGRGLEGGAPRRRWWIRLAQAQTTGARTAWKKNMPLLRRWVSDSRGQPLLVSGPIALQPLFLSNLRNTCPGIRRLQADLWAGIGALGACRTVKPNMTAARLASDLTAFERRQLMITVRERIFARQAVRISLASSKRLLVSDMKKTPKQRKHLLRWLRRNFKRGYITREQALNDLL